MKFINEKPRHKPRRPPKLPGKEKGGVDELYDEVRAGKWTKEAKTRPAERGKKGKM